MPDFKVHSDVDAEFTELGNIRYVNGQLIISNVNVAERFAANLGILGGGVRRGVLHMTFNAISMANVDSDGTLGGHFSEFGPKPE